MKNVLRLILIILICSFYSCGNKSNTGQAIEQKEDCCKKQGKSETSEITCPKCGNKKVEKLPTDVCQLFYTCEKCKTVMHPKNGDCCVFCTYGDHKCPSMQ